MHLLELTFTFVLVDTRKNANSSMTQVSVILKPIKNPNQQKVPQYMLLQWFFLSLMSFYLRKTLTKKHMLYIEKKILKSK